MLKKLPSLVAVACFLPGWAKDLSAPPRTCQQPLCCSAQVDVLEMAKAQLLLTAIPGTTVLETE